MRPRTAPSDFGVTDSALAAAARYGATNRYRQAVDHALAVVWEYEKVGLPEALEFDDLKGTWWLYVDEVQDIYLGFAESARGESLRLVALAPKREITRAAFLQSRWDAV
jgi:hypothetical protein